MSNGNFNCPFCREPPPEDYEEFDKRMMKRIKANDPAALREMGRMRYHKGDWDTAVAYWTKAAELGDAPSHYSLGGMYWKGEGVAKDEEKGVYHYEKAAIAGHPWARNMLGCIEGKHENYERSVKHFIIAANLGSEESMKALWTYYSVGCNTKEDLEATLRTHKAALDEMKSAQRDAADSLFKGLLNGQHLSLNVNWGSYHL